MSSDVWFAPLIGILGVVIGFVLNEGRAWARERKAEQRKNANVRTLVAIEAEHNLERLRESWQPLSDYGERKDFGEPWPRPYAMALMLLKQPWPQWSRAVWDGQQPDLASALTDEQIRRAYRLYSRLQLLDSLRSTVLRAHDVYQATQNSRQLERDGVAAIRLRRDIEELWPQFEQTTIEVLEAGNPLRWYVPSA